MLFAVSDRYQGDDARRARAVAIMALLVLPWSPIIALGLAFLDEPIPAIAIGLVGPGCGASWWMVRRGASLDWAGNLLVFSLMQSLWISAWLLGGVGSPPTQWWVLGPVLATAVGGVRSGVAWTGANVIAAIAVLGVQLAGLVPLPYLYGGWTALGTLTAIGSYLLMGAFLWANDGLYRRLLDRVRAAEEAEREANRAKSSFLANMSHELRTPLNAVLGYAELVAEDAAALGQQGMVDDLGKAQRSGRHLLRLVNDILDLSKIEAGRLELALVDVDVEQLVEEAADEVAGLFAEHNNRLIREVRPHRVRADRLRLRQCLLNLLSNAGKFTLDGTVTVRFDGGVCEVIDTGVGMNEAQQLRLFVPFVQGDAEIAVTYGGTGLGLAIVQRLLRQMGGDISIRSAPGAGTTARFWVPVAG
jgi:signal transduction histidine kinase